MINTDDCWLWAGYVNKLGYGMYQIKIDGKWRERRAHRLMYESVKGKIPDGLVLDHLCRVTTCINPEHLEPVTIGENVLRGDGVKLHSSKTHCPSGHPYSGKNLILKKSGKYTFRVCKTCHYNEKNERYRKNHSPAANYTIRRNI